MSLKVDLPNICKVEIPKAALIEEFDEDYILCAHPFPQMAGELILFQNNEQETKKCFLYNDFSLQKRAKTTKKPA